MKICYHKKWVRTILLVMMMHMGCSFTYAQYAQDNTENNPGEYLNLRRGVVVDDFGNPLEGVHITIKGQDGTVVSNAAGYFEISGPENSTLIFRHPDYETRQLKISGSEHFLGGKADNSNAAGMESDDLGEIGKYFSPQMTDGYVPVKMTNTHLRDPEEISVLHGTANPETMVGSVSTVYTNQLNTTLAPSYSYALPGRLAGLYTNQVRGFGVAGIGASTVNIFGFYNPNTGVPEPTDNTEMTLSLRGQNPVVIVDGVQRSMFSIDPGNIESVTVLKDPLSAISLGLKSSRGVLLVTTKEPGGNDLRLSFTAKTGIQQSLNVPQPVPAYQYAYLMNEALQNDGLDPVYSAEEFEALRNGTGSVLNPQTDWYGRLLKDQSLMSNYSLNVSDGGDVMSYIVNMNYLKQQGMFKTSGLSGYNTNLELDRYLINSKVNVNVMEGFDVGLQILGRIQDRNQPGATAGGILSGIYTTPSNAYPVKNPDGSYGGNTTFQNNLLSQTVNSGYIKSNRRDVMINTDLEYDLDEIFLEGLSVTAAANYSTHSTSALNRSKRSQVFEMTVDPGGDTTYTDFGASVPQSNNFITTGNAKFWYVQSALEYDNQFGKHDVGGTLMADRRSVLINFDLPDVTANFVARGSYSYDNTYFAEAAVNYSGYNGYKPGNQYGLFYAFGVGWDIARESFIEDNISWLNQLKIRGVYGKTGNGVDNAGYFLWRARTFSYTLFSYPLGTNRSWTFNDGWTSNGLSNPNITWEKAHKVSLGIDISMFNNRLQLTGDYYYDEYYDLLQQRGSKIDLMGLPYPIENIGRNFYQGGEVSLTYRDNMGNFNYFVRGNWSLRASEVLYMDEQVRPHKWNERTGQPAGTRFGLIADGFFDSVEEIEQSATINGYEVQPGDIKYKDLNKDGVIDQFDLSPIANTSPLSFFGLSTGLSFKGFDFSILLQGAYNRDMYVQRRSFEWLFGEGNTGQAYRYIRNRWTPATAETATYPRLSTTGGLSGDTNNLSPNGWSTSFWVKSGNYIRIKNVSLKYTLPFEWTHRLNLSEVKIFINALNLYTLAAYDKVDPEVSSFTNYPLQRVISTGINIKL